MVGKRALGERDESWRDFSLICVVLCKFIFPSFNSNLYTKT